MFRKTGVLLCVLAFSLVVFASCAGAVTIKWLHYYDITAPGAEVELDIIQTFAQLNPDIKLEIETLYDQAYHQKLAALAAAGQTPDVMYLWPGERTGKITGSGLIADLYPFLGDDIDNYVPAAVAPQLLGRLHELPMFSGTASHMLYVNTELLDRLGLAMPQTYKELKAMVPAIKGAGLEGIVIAAKETWVMQSCLLSAIVGRTAGDEWLMKAIAGEASFEDEGFLWALRIVEEMYATGLISESNVQLGYGDAPNVFAEDKAVFYIDGDWRVSAFSAVPDGLMTAEKQEKIALTVLPDFAGQVGPSGSTSFVVSTGLGMKAGLSKEKAEAAWKLVSFYVGPIASKKRLLGGSLKPPSLANLDISDVEMPPLDRKLFAFYPLHPATLILDAVIPADGVQRINTGLQELALGDITPEQLAAEIEAAVASVR